MSYKPLIIEICPREPRASMCLADGASVRGSEHESDVLDCTKSGDASEACQFIRDIGVDFRIVAKNEAGEYENRAATDDEIGETCRAIYFDSETDFSDMVNAEMYLIWEAANGVANEEEDED